MGKTISLVAAAVLAAGLCSVAAGTAFAANPVDQVSNPAARDYTDVEISPQEMGVPFVRDGVVTRPQVFATIRAGLTQAQVRSTLGEPLRQQDARRPEWEYNFRFRMPESQNFLVCQYKVVFDDQQLVRDTTWRRRQCQNLAAGRAMN